MKKRLILAAAMLLMASAVFAQGLPGGKWWRRSEVVERLQITRDQQVRLDDIFNKSATDLIDLKAEVEKGNVELRAELDQPQLNRDAIRRAGARLNEARARLFERELMLLVDMRGILNEDQWEKFRHVLENRDQRRDLRRDQRPPMKRR